MKIQDLKEKQWWISQWHNFAHKRDFLKLVKFYFLKKRPYMKIDQIEGDYVGDEEFENFVIKLKRTWVDKEFISFLNRNIWVPYHFEIVDEKLVLDIPKELYFREEPEEEEVVEDYIVDIATGEKIILKEGDIKNVHADETETSTVDNI